MQKYAHQETEPLASISIIGEVLEMKDIAEYWWLDREFTVILHFRSWKD